MKVWMHLKGLSPYPHEPAQGLCTMGNLWRINFFPRLAIHIIQPWFKNTQASTCSVVTPRAPSAKLTSVHYLLWGCSPSQNPIQVINNQEGYIWSINSNTGKVLKHWYLLAQKNILITSTLFYDQFACLAPYGVLWASHHTNWYASSSMLV